MMQLGIKKVMGITQDSALCALLGEWDYEIKRDAWIFCDSERKTRGEDKRCCFPKSGKQETAPG